MAVVSPLGLMVTASLACAAGLMLLLGSESRGGVAAGAVGPLIAAVGTWIMVARLHRRAPAEVPPAMIKLFAAKMLLFGAYVAAAVTLLPISTRAFVASFASQYIMLHFMEAVFLRRLFAGTDRPAGTD